VLKVLELFLEGLVEADHHRRVVRIPLDDRALRLEVFRDRVLELGVSLAKVLVRIRCRHPSPSRPARSARRVRVRDVRPVGQKMNPATVSA
jgi:hypothetical protein